MLNLELSCGDLQGAFQTRSLLTLSLVVSPNLDQLVSTDWSVRQGKSDEDLLHGLLKLKERATVSSLCFMIFNKRIFFFTRVAPSTRVFKESSQSTLFLESLKKKFRHGCETSVLLRRMNRDSLRGADGG
jgi:hypothetical protein